MASQDPYKGAIDELIEILYFEGFFFFTQKDEKMLIVNNKQLTGSLHTEKKKDCTSNYKGV